MSTTKGTFKEIAFERIPTNYAEHNVRYVEGLNVDEVYAVGSLDDEASLAYDILMNGLKDPLKLHFNSETKQFDEVLAGCRRMHSLLAIKDKANVAFREKFSKIPAIVYTDLSEKQKLLIRADHGQVAKLRPIDQFFTLHKMFKNAITEATMIATLGKSKGYVQSRTRIMKSPPCVLEAHLNFLLGREGVQVNAAQAHKLYDAACVDRDNNSTPISEGGKAFQAAWDSFVNNGKVVEAKPKVRTIKEINDQIDRSQSKAFRALLKWAKGEDIATLGDLDTHLKSQETD